jgi:hypothetical protein
MGCKTPDFLYMEVLVKKASFTLVFSILAIIAIVGTAMAEGSALPGSGWWSGEQIQNVGSGVATIDITAYDSASTATYSVSDSINPGAAKTYLPGSFTGMPSGFQGSAIVSSNQDIRAIVNVTNSASGSLGDPLSVSPGAAQYQGTNEPATTLNFPLAKNDRGGKSTTFFIQNAGTTAATASVVFKMAVPPAAPTTYNFTTPSIGPGQMYVLSPSDASVPANTVGSLTVSSSQPLAGTVLEHKTVELHATVLQATRAFTPSDYDTTVFAPIIKKGRLGRSTGLQVQNVTGGAIDVTVNYKGSAGACAGNSYSENTTGLAAGAGFTFLHAVLPSDCTAAATVTATGNIVAIVNESFDPAFLAANPGRSQEAVTYSAQPNNKATTVISLPLFKEDANSKSTGISVQNVGGSSTTVVLTFKNSVGTFVSTPQSIPAGGNVVFIDVRLKPASFWSGTAMTPALLGCVNALAGCGANGNFGVVVTSASQNIVAIANESTYPNPPRKLQDKNNYEGFNLATAP